MVADDRRPEITARDETSTVIQGPGEREDVISFGCECPGIADAVIVGVLLVMLIGGQCLS